MQFVNVYVEKCHLKCDFKMCVGWRRSHVEWMGVHCRSFAFRIEICDWGSCLSNSLIDWVWGEGLSEITISINYVEYEGISLLNRLDNHNDYGDGNHKESKDICPSIIRQLANGNSSVKGHYWIRHYKWSTRTALNNKRRWPSLFQRVLFFPIKLSCFKSPAVISTERQRATTDHEIGLHQPLSPCSNVLPFHGPLKNMEAMSSIFSTHSTP